MKIMLISSFAIPTRPSEEMLYGGLERVCYQEAQGLTELGHEVSLVASKDSKAPSGVRLIETLPAWNTLTQAQQQDYGKRDGVWREYNGQKWLAHTWNGWRMQEEEAFALYKDFVPEMDVVGDLSWAKWSYSTKKDEIIGTCHSVKSYMVMPPRKFPLLTGVSRGHARFLTRELHIPVRTVWNPVDVDNLPFEPVKTGNVLSLNRIMPQKGIHLFLDLVESQKIKADIAGDDSTLVPDQGYVQMIKNRCKQSAFANYYGLVDDKKRIELLKLAKCLVAFKDFGYEEVFGLQVVEALSCGTPVIALRSWGFEDTIINGENGYICDDMKQIELALQKIDQIKPENCRKSAERFNIKNTTKLYEQMMFKVQAGSRW